MDTGSMEIKQLRQNNMASTRGIFAVAMAIAFALAMSPLANAQEKLQLKPGVGTQAGQGGQPVLVATIGSLNKVMQDANYLSAAVGQPQAGASLGMVTAMFAQGVDMNQPIGITVSVVDGVPLPTAFLPVSDVKGFLKRLEAQTGPTDELEDGTIVVTVGANTLFIKQSGPWAVVSNQKDTLANAPADPTAYFVGMGNEYDLAFQVKIQEIPEQIRQILIAQMRQGSEQAAQKQNEENAKATREIAQASLKQIEQFFNEAEQLMVGFNVDEPGKQVVIDSVFTGVPGTELAAVYGGTQSIPSAFASVIRDDAAAHYHTAVSFSPEVIQQADRSIANAMKMVGGLIDNEESLDDTDRADIKLLLDDVSEVMIESFKEGKADIGAMVMSGPEKFQFVLGSFVSNGDKVAKIVKDTAAKLEARFGDDEDMPAFIFDKETYKGVTLHVVEKELPEGKERDREIFGEKAQIHVGTGPKAVYIAAGKGSLALMKELIDSQSSDAGAVRPLGQMKVQLLPFFEFAQSLENKDEIADIIDELSRATEPGVIQLIQDGIANGQKGKFTISEGVLKAIGAAIQNANAPNRGGF